MTLKSIKSVGAYLALLALVLFAHVLASHWDSRSSDAPIRPTKHV